MTTTQYFSSVALSAELCTLVHAIMQVLFGTLAAVRFVQAARYA
jgi:hypothetical protein